MHLRTLPSRHSCSGRDLPRNRSATLIWGKMKVVKVDNRYQYIVYRDDGTVALVTSNSKIAQDYIKNNTIRSGYQEDNK